MRMQSFCLALMWDAHRLERAALQSKGPEMP